MQKYLDELKTLLEHATREQLLEVILEKDKSFGKQVMDIARTLQANGVIPEDCGQIHWQAMVSQSKLSLNPVPKDKELYDILKTDQLNRWVEAQKDLCAKYFPNEPGNVIAGNVFNYLHGHYPSLKMFPEVLVVFVTLRNFLGRNPEEFELKKAGLNTNRMMVKKAIRAVRVYIVDTYVEN